jgi:hypothetical protein
MADLHKFASSKNLRSLSMLNDRFLTQGCLLVRRKISSGRPARPVLIAKILRNGASRLIVHFWQSRWAKFLNFALAELASTP